MKISRTTDIQNRSELDWLRSSSCASNGCLEVAFTEREVKMRNSNTPEDAIISCDHAEWLAFIVAAKAGEFDLDFVSVSQRAKSISEPL